MSDKAEPIVLVPREDGDCCGDSCAGYAENDCGQQVDTDICAACGPAVTGYTMQTLAEYEAAQWVSVEDALPDAFQLVQLTCLEASAEERYFHSIGMRKPLVGGESIFECSLRGSTTWLTVTHWRELPAAKGGE